MAVDYRVDEQGGVRWVIDVAVRGGADEAAEQLAREVPGGRVVTTDDALVDALLARGARLRRRAHDYVYDLAGELPGARALPEGLTLRGVEDGDVAAVAAVHAAAYPPEHPDHRLGQDAAATIGDVLAGNVLGPLVGRASFVAEAAGEVVGAVLVVDRPAFGGDSARGWVVDVAVDPAWQGRGVGGALLRAALAGAREAGLSLVGLVVTAGNEAAVRAYESLGFRRLYSGASVDLPGGPAPT